jgi:hypothetical protein
LVGLDWIGSFGPCFARQKNSPSVAACLDGCKRSLVFSRADNQGGPGEKNVHILHF